MRSTSIILLLTLVFFSCSSTFVQRTPREQISLKGIEPEAVKIGIENERSTVKFRKTNLIRLFKIENADFSSKQRRDRIERLEKIETDSIIPITKSSTDFWELEIKFHELLNQGKAEVFDKRSMELVERIGYEKSVDKLGGVQVEYTFMDGTVFYSTILKLGE